jgi:hypothetical protein
MEISIGGIYFPPIMFAILLGVLFAGIIAKLLNRFNLTRFIWHPPLFFIALSPNNNVGTPGDFRTHQKR